MKGKGPKENDPRAQLTKDKVMETSLVPYSWPIEIHKKLQCWQHQSDGLFHISNELVEIQQLRRASDDIFSLCRRGEYLSLVKDVIYNNIRAGGFLPYHCFVILILELVFCKKKYLIECLDRLEKEVGGCPQSRNLLSTLGSYSKVLSRWYSTKSKVLPDEISLFFVTASLFSHTKELGEQLLNKYRMATKQVVTCRKLISGDVDSEKPPATFDHTLWADEEYTLVARLALVIWALSLCLRLKEIDLAMDLLGYIPQRAKNYNIVREAKSIVIAEKAREVYTTDGATKEVYHFLLESLSNSYSWDVIIDIHNCLAQNFRADIFRLFRPGGKFHDLLDLHGKLCMALSLPLDEQLLELEGLIDESIKEKNGRVVEVLVAAYLENGLVDKAENFINLMEKIEWDFERSGKGDFISEARFRLALKKNDHENVIIMGQRFISTYRRNRTSYLGWFYYELGEACFKLGKHDLAKRYCNKGLTYGGHYDVLRKLKQQILEKERTT